MDKDVGVDRLDAVYSRLFSIEKNILKKLTGIECEMLR